MEISRRQFVCALSFVLVIAVCQPQVAFAQQILEPKRGTALRKQLLNVARPTFELESAGPIEFVVDRLAIWGDWAFGAVQLQRPGGRKIDWSKTNHAGDFAVETETSFFLLKRKNGNWKMSAYALAPTDVAWDGWREEFKLPLELFLEPELIP